MPPKAVFLNVAEKPSVAREMAKTLGGNNSVSRPGLSQYNQVYEFNMNVQRQEVKMIVTSVTGHLMGIEFPPETKDWRSFTTDKLFEYPVKKSVADDKKRVEDNLKREARLATHIVCWLDCDREGENISFEVIQVCKAANPRLEVLRAKFSSLTARDLNRAVQTLGIPDENSSLAVDARQEIDLRIGAVFTRFQTLLLRERFAQMPKVISYGPCQFPTLGFIVSRYWEREGFQSENFWAIKLSHQQDANPINFKWARDRLFDQTIAVVLYEQCTTHPTTTITKVVRKPKSKWRPVPLATVEMQKLAARHLRFNSEKTMRLAEELYQETLFSYPRTETDRFNITDEELGVLVKIHYDGDHAAYAKGLMEEGKYNRPRVGRNDDQAHPPIHPTKKGTHLTGDKKALYELVSRHFLASCSKDATADEVVVTATCSGEEFTTQGQTITARNYLDIYIYEKWYDSTIPNYQEGDEFTPSKLWLDESLTTPPTLLTETDLIATMDRNGIGTDATIAQHIKTVKDREYVTVEGMSYTPTKLGLALVQAYDEMGFASLALPKMRAAMEADLVDIVKGKTTKALVVEKHISEYRLIYRKAIMKTGLLLSAVGRWYGRNEDTGTVVDPALSQCGKCKKMMKLTATSDDSKTLSCSECSLALLLPKGSFTANIHICPLCSFQVLDVKGSSNKSHNICPYCYSHPPKVIGDVEATLSVMRCFQCTHAACSLATARTQIWKCPNKGCGEGMDIIKKKDGGFFIGCKGYKNNCTHSVHLPSHVDLQVTSETCPVHQGARKVSLQFRHGVHPPEWMMYCDSYFSLTCCLWCEDRLDQELSVKGLLAPGARGHRNVLQAQQPPQTPSFFNPAANMAAPPSAGPSCDCGVPCATKTARTGTNNGRTFYACSTSACRYFKWCADYVPSANVPNCLCNLPCDSRTANTDKNRGRVFYKCPKRSEACSFFEWADSQSNPPARSAGPAGGGGGGGGGFVRASDMH
eukprot:TRINITY_DN1051_c3_g1_i1.p1 TRINITY_DN1051_c3_g1~~TRINITY_DN1051_c3_g1_i1.p1  ORF type:complete len:984 (+),score=167.12 TRINITY_DN1051_c3_g1_i1:67-3018(+)